MHNQLTTNVMKELLKKLDACQSAIEWAGEKTWQEVYSTCHRGDWLLWLFKRTNTDNLRGLTLVKGHCANTVRHLMKDQRSIDAVDAAIAFGEGRITLQELRAAAHAAYDAAYDAAAYAAYAAAYDAAAYDAAAAAVVAAVFARERNQKLTADICRKYLPIEIWNIKG